MIEFTKAFITTDNQTHATLQAAQRHELGIQLKSVTGGSVTSEALEKVSDGLMSKPDVFVDILTTTPNSRPKARKVNGGRKTRAGKPTTLPATPPTGTQTA